MVENVVGVATPFRLYEYSLSRFRSQGLFLRPQFFLYESVNIDKERRNLVASGVIERARILHGKARVVRRDVGVVRADANGHIGGILREAGDKVGNGHENLAF